MFDINEIKNQFIKVIEHSQDIKEPKVDKLFDNWLEAKKDFIKSMNGELRLCFPDVKFYLEEAERKNRVHSFVEHLEVDYELFDLALFINSNINSFYENKVSFLPGFLNRNRWEPEKPYVPYEAYKDIKIGMKLLKAFKYFINKNDLELLERVQTEASMIIQEDKIEGDFYISVHPLDFLSSSENTYNWRSCHALNGEYRCGNLSYMCDKSTVICYLASKEDKELPRFPKDVPWNSKKWRMLLHFSDNKDMVFAGRQYPFFSKNILNYSLYEVIEKYFNLKNFTWGKWSNFSIKEVHDSSTGEDKYLSDSFLLINEQLIGIKSIVKDAYNSKHFNDILHSSVYKPYYSKRNNSDFYPSESVYLKGLHFSIGSATTCLSCGKQDVSAYGMMVCPTCDCEKYHFGPDNNYIMCYSCGTLHYIDDSATYGQDEGFLCPECADNLCSYCSHCRYLYLTDELTYHREIGASICKWCEEEITFED